MSVKHFKNKLYNVSELGIGLVETMLSLGIGLIIITSMVSLSIFTLRASTQNKLALTGTQVANQQTELIRAYRDSQSSWLDFISAVDGTLGVDCFTNDCYMTDSGVLTVVSGVMITNGGTVEEMRKSFRLSDQSGGAKTLIRVAVNVSWQVGANTKYAHNYTELSSWRSN